MSAGYDNVFPIPDADKYSCKIHIYERGHSGLFIEVNNYQESPFYLYFADVDYFAGPPSWQSVNFKRLEKRDALSLLRTIRFFDVWSNEWLLDRKRVFVVGDPGSFVFIVAGEVERIDDIKKIGR